MGDYYSYRSARSYGDDDDFVSSKNRNLHRLAADTLDDNDEIARRSKRHDEKLLNQITTKLNNWEVENQKPSYEVRERVGSSVRRNIDDTERRRAQLKNPALRRATHEKRASSYLDDSDDTISERPRSLNLSHEPAATLRQTYSPLRGSSPYASPFKYTSLADEFSTHKPYVRKYGLELTTASAEHSSSPATRLGSELIRSATEHRPKPTYLDDDDLEEIDVENLFPKRRVIYTAPSDDEDDDEPYVPPPTRTLNGTHSPGSYEYNYEDYEDEDSYLVEGDVHTRAGEISRRYKAGEGLYGHIDYHKRLYSDWDYSREYRRPYMSYDDCGEEYDYVSPRKYKFSTECEDRYTSPYKSSYTSPAFDEEYTPSYKYRPSVAALDSKFSKLDTMPRSRLDQTEAWMAMQSNHRALEDKEPCSSLDRIRVKAALIEKTLPATPRRRKFLSAGSYTGSSKDHGSSCINHVDYESGYTSKYGGHKSRETTRSDPGYKELPASISPEPRKDFKPEYYVFSPDEERTAPQFDDEEDTVVISAKKPTVVIDDEEDDEPLSVSIKPAAEPQVAAEVTEVAEVAQTAESVVPIELEEHSPEKEALEAK